MTTKISDSVCFATFLFLPVATETPLLQILNRFENYTIPDKSIVSSKNGVITITLEKDNKIYPTEFVCPTDEDETLRKLHEFFDLFINEFVKHEVINEISFNVDDDKHKISYQVKLDNKVLSEQETDIPQIYKENQVMDLLIEAMSLMLGKELEFVRS